MLDVVMNGEPPTGAAQSAGAFTGNSTTSHYVLDELMRRSGSDLLARAVRLTRNQADAWDLLQDGIERLLTHCQDRSSADAMKRWLLVTMRNLNTDRYRAAQRHRQVALTEDVLMFDPSSCLEEPLWASVDPRHLDCCVAQLAPDLRRAYHLTVERRLPLAMAAQALGIPIGTVGTRVHRARRRLKLLLARELPVAMGGVNEARQAACGRKHDLGVALGRP